MSYWLRRILLAAAAIAAAAAGLVYGLGPHAATAAAFERYRAASLAGDAGLVTRLTSAREIAYFDEQRRHALLSPRAITETLSYRQRMTILTMRKLVLDGALRIDVLRDTSPEKLYEMTRAVWQNSRALQQMDVLFAVPTGVGSATGYMSLTRFPGAHFQQMLMALSWGTAFGFERRADGTWLVDPTPLYETSARENEYWATKMEPSGNVFLTKSYLKADPLRAEALWQSLL